MTTTNNTTNKWNDGVSVGFTDVWPPKVVVPSQIARELALAANIARSEKKSEIGASLRMIPKTTDKGVLFYEVGEYRFYPQTGHGGYWESDPGAQNDHMKELVDAGKIDEIEQWCGLWHSHPTGMSASMSGTDKQQLLDLAGESLGFSLIMPANNNGDEVRPESWRYHFADGRIGMVGQAVVVENLRPDQYLLFEKSPPAGFKKMHDIVNSQLKDRPTATTSSKGGRVWTPAQRQLGYSNTTASYKWENGEKVEFLDGNIPSCREAVVKWGELVEIPDTSVAGLRGDLPTIYWEDSRLPKGAQKNMMCVPQEGDWVLVSAILPSAEDVFTTKEARKAAQRLVDSKEPWRVTKVEGRCILVGGVWIDCDDDIVEMIARTRSRDLSDMWANYQKNGIAKKSGPYLRTKVEYTDAEDAALQELHQRHLDQIEQAIT